MFCEGRGSEFLSLCQWRSNWRQIHPGIKAPNTPMHQERNLGDSNLCLCSVCCMLQTPIIHNDHQTHSVIRHIFLLERVFFWQAPSGRCLQPPWSGQPNTVKVHIRAQSAGAAHTSSPCEVLVSWSSTGGQPLQADLNVL